MLTFLLRELDEILRFWPILESHSWELHTVQQRILEFSCDEVMLNSLEVPRNWNFVNHRRGRSMNLCTRKERGEWKRKRRITSFCLFPALLEFTLSVQVVKSSESSFFLSVPHFGSISIFFHSSFYKVFYYGLTLHYLLLLCHLNFNLNNPNNCNKSYLVPRKKNFLYSNFALVIFLYLSAVSLKSEVHSNEQGRIHQCKAKTPVHQQVWILVSHADY